MNPASHIERELNASAIVGLYNEIRVNLLLFLVVAMAVAGLVCAYALLAPPRYRVAVKVLIGSGDQQASGLQSLVSQFGGLASLAGLNLGGSVDEQEALAWLKSRRLAEEFIVNEGLMPVIFPKQWDAVGNKWKSALKREEVPTIDTAWNVFDHDLRRVDQDQKTRIVTVQFIWRDRNLATKWANDFVSLANARLRSKANEEVDASLRILDDQLKRTSVVELQQTIYKMMATQINRKVLANSRPDYAYSVIDPAVTPDESRFDTPRRRLLIILAGPLGVFSASCAVIVLAQARRLFLP